MQHVVVKKWGNSHGIRLSSAVLSALGVESGATLEADMRDGVLTLKRPAGRVRRRFNVEALVRQINPENDHGELDWGDDRAREEIE